MTDDLRFTLEATPAMGLSLSTLSLSISRVALSPFCAEAIALFDAMEVKPPRARMLSINALIVALIDAGVWAKLDVFDVFAAHSEQAAMLNWKSPGTQDPTNVGGASFEADRGVTGNGSTSYVNANFNPSSGSHQYVRNSASFGGWARTAALSTALDIGRGGVARNQLAFRTTSNLIGSGRINDVTTSTPADTVVATAVGLTALDRPDGSTKRFFKNGAQVGADVSVSSDATLPDGFLIGGSQSAGTSTRQFSMFFAGASLGAGHAALYAAMLIYLQAVGAA